MIFLHLYEKKNLLVDQMVKDEIHSYNINHKKWPIHTNIAWLLRGRLTREIPFSAFLEKPFSKEVSICEGSASGYLSEISYFGEEVEGPCAGHIHRYHR